jgi:hypothetical protein
MMMTLMTKIISNTKLLLLFITLFFSGCSKFNLAKEKSNQQRYTCQVEGQPIKVFSDNEKLNELLSQKVQKLRFMDAYFYISLANLSASPEATTLDAKTLTYMKYKGTEYVVNVFPKEEGANSFLLSMINIQENFNHKKSLWSYTQSFYTENAHFPIGQQTQLFLEENKTKLADNKNIRRFVFKGNQILKKEESLPAARLRKFGHMPVPSKSLVINQLFPQNNRMCNFDDRLYGTNPTLQKKTVKTYTNIFGFYQDKDNFFITITNARPKIDNLSRKSLMFKSEIDSTMNIAFCKVQDNKFLMMKNDYHSQQLLNNIFSQTKSLDPNDLINTTRYLNLNHPKRAVIEIFGQSAPKEVPRTKYFIPIMGKLKILEASGETGILYKDPREPGLQCK